MQKRRYVILGAGPAGLAFANRLKQNGEDSFIVLEKEKKAGGLCRSEMVDGSPLDIGGGHFLDVRRPKVNEFLFGFMSKEEWNRYDRDSRIQLKEDCVHHPLEANIWEMSVENQVRYLKSISQAGCNREEPIPEKFVDWIYWKLGDEIAENYMLPYNSKMFADDLNDLGIYWLEKLPNVSFEETLLSCLQKKAYGTQPGHAQFYYPKQYGYGDLWERMAAKLQGAVVYDQDITELDFETKTVQTAAGEEYQADIIVTTIPWKEFQVIKGMPQEIHRCVKRLKHSSVEIRYYSKQLDTAAHWIYYPDEKLPYHRILVRHNFCENSQGYWTETRKERVALFPDEDNFRYLNEYAYPLNTLDKPVAIGQLLKWSREHSVYGLGRWGEHEHYNSDVVVERAMQLADQFCESDAGKNE